MTNDTLEKGLIEVEPINCESAELATIDANDLLNTIQSLVITNDVERVEAGKLFNVARDRMKKIEEERKKITVPLNKALDAVNDLFKKPLSLFKSARDTVEQKSVAYDNKKEEERKVEEERLAAIAKKEEERLKKAKEDQAKAWKEKADKLAAEGKTEEAEKALAKADERTMQAAEVFVPAPTVEKEKVKVAGEKDVTRWYHKVIDPSLVPDDFWVIDEQKLAKFATATKGTVKVAGVQFYSQKKLS